MRRPERLGAEDPPPPPPPPPRNLSSTPLDLAPLHAGTHGPAETHSTYLFKQHTHIRSRPLSPARAPGAGSARRGLEERCAGEGAPSPPLLRPPTPARPPACRTRRQTLCAFGEIKSKRREGPVWARRGKGRGSRRATPPRGRRRAGRNRSGTPWPSSRTRRCVLRPAADAAGAPSHPPPHPRVPGVPARRSGLQQKVQAV